MRLQDSADAAVETLDVAIGLRSSLPGQMMLDAQCLSQRVKRMLAGRLSVSRADMNAEWTAFATTGRGVRRLPTSWRRRQQSRRERENAGQGNSPVSARRSSKGSRSVLRNWITMVSCAALKVVGE